MNDVRMAELGDVSSTKIQELLKKYGPNSKSAKDEKSEIPNKNLATSKPSTVYHDEPVPLKSSLVREISPPPTPSPVDCSSNSHSSASNVSHSSSSSSFTMPCVYKLDCKPPLPLAPLMTPRHSKNYSVLADKQKILVDKEVQASFGNDENIPPGVSEGSTYLLKQLKAKEDDNIRLKNTEKEYEEQIKKLRKENEYLEIQFKRMQANSSAKSILTDSKVHTQEMGRKIAALQKENTYLVNQVKKMQSESSMQAVFPSSQNKSDSVEQVMICNKNYDVWKKPIGKGASCQVYRGFYNEMVAIKVVSIQKLNPKNKDEMEREINLLKSLKNEDCIINLIDFEYIKDKNRLTLVLEYGETDLHSYLQNTACLRDNPTKQKYYEVCLLWHEMLTAVQCIHSHKIVHKDLKPQNFMKVKGKVKLIDFGISQKIADADMTSMIIQQPEGTPNYIAPEMLSGTFGAAKTNVLGYRSDVYSLGCILYKMCFGCTPYQHIDKMQMKYMAIISEDPVSIPALPYEHIVEALVHSLHKDRSKRPTVAQLLDK